MQPFDENLSWLRNLRENIYSFISRMNVNGDFTYFKYSYSGDLYGPNITWGLGQLVFATKILFMLDKTNDLTPAHRYNLINAINSFQTEDGYYSDTFIIKPSKRRIFLNRFRRTKSSFSYEALKRAETRQSFAALLALSSKPARPFLHIPKSEREIDQYLTKLDWKRPSGAASHFSHLLFFLHYNKVLFGLYEDKADALIEHAIDWVNKLQSPEDGCWYRGKVSDLHKTNGAMKIFTGLSATKRLSFSYPERIIDTSLRVAEGKNACNNFNVVYALYCCSKVVNYRTEDIKKFCLSKLNQYRQYYYEDKGGFSFRLGKANDVYYSARITKGLNEPDIHGTVMFLWGITLISAILGLDIELKEPIN